MMMARSRYVGAYLSALTLLIVSGPTNAALLYQASLKNGDYGGGFIVDTFTSCGDADGSSCGDGDLSNIGITDSANGVTYTNSNAVINYSLGADGKGGVKQSSFRSHGTVSVRFKADLQTFASGQPFVDNYGFNQFRTGQATFGTGLSRNTGSDGITGTPDDQLSVGWSTWHSNVWYNHITSPVLIDFDEWHHLGFAWGGPLDHFEVWVDGALRASHDVPASGAWGSSGFSLGSAYNFALGEIHERQLGNSSVYGITFADLEIWDEYRAFGATQAPNQDPTIPEPATLLLMGIGLAGLGFARRHRLRA